MAVQALGAFTYDGRWDRLHRGPAGELGRVRLGPREKPIALQARERVARLARPGLEGRRLVQRERVVAPSGASGSFVSFAKLPVRPTGVEATMSGVRLEGGARVAAGRLELKAAGDGLAFRVPEGARSRRLELRIAGRGTGLLGLGESGLRGEPHWRDRAVGSFRLRLPYHYPESGGADLRLTLRSSGAVALESVALVPPTEPENFFRLSP